MPLQRNFDYNTLSISAFKKQVKTYFSSIQELVLRNISVKTASLVSIFPSGEYKMIFYFFDDKDDSMLVVNVLANMDTSNKDTFG